MGQHISLCVDFWLLGSESTLPGMVSVTTCMAPVAQMVKSLPAMQETQVWSLGQKDPLKKEMATYSSILAWEIPWTEEPGELRSSRTRQSD